MTSRGWFENEAAETLGRPPAKCLIECRGLFRGGSCGNGVRRAECSGESGSFHFFFFRPVLLGNPRLAVIHISTRHMLLQGYDYAPGRLGKGA